MGLRLIPTPATRSARLGRFHVDLRLRWYDYRGTGEFDPSGSVGWQPNSGNLIGNGWNDFRHLMCSVMDANGFYELYGSEPGGILRWYQYYGQGVPDPSGATGWHPYSRNIIIGTW